MKFLKRVYDWLKVHMNPRINQQAISNWQAWLNRAYPPGPWMPIEGFNTALQMSPASSGITINHSSGYPMKGFINTSTGEVKFFDARKFYA